MVKKIEKRYNKKSQNLSLQTVVVAALVLLVMIVLMIIFGGKSKPVADLYSKCEGDLEGQMIDAEFDCEEKTGMPYTHPLYKETDKDGKVIKKCCVKNLV